MAKNTYTDFRIESRGRTYYLRKKYSRAGSWLRITIRTQRGGKGSKLKEVEGNIRNGESEIELLHKLHKKIKFQFVILQDIPELPK